MDQSGVLDGRWRRTWRSVQIIQGGIRQPADGGLRRVIGANYAPANHPSGPHRPKGEAMAKFGFPVPIVPGKEDLAGRIYDEMRARMGEYEESRRNAGLTLERTYFQRNPDGSTLLVVYAEGSGSMGDVARAFATSGTSFDQWFMDVNQELSGIDFRQPPPGGWPEHIASWEAPSGARGKGIALCAPLLPGKIEAGKSWAKEAFEDRREEMAESRLALGSTREEVFLNSTPMGDFAVVYIEGEDPVRANKEFAASN